MSTAKPTTNPEQNLAIREMILGVLKSRAVSGQAVIHSSDFRSAITGLGFPMGSSVIENILVHCKIDGRGNLNFADLESELLRERRLLNAQKKVDKAPLSTSSGVVAKPWRGDEFHRSKVAAEKQLRKVTEHGQTVQEIYHELSHHLIGPREALQRLEALDILPTKDFMKLLQRMAIAEATYAQFVKSLTQGDPAQQDLEALNVAAGSARPKQADVTDIIGLQRKRSTLGMKTAFHESADVEVKPRTIRKVVFDGVNVDRARTRAAQVKETLFNDSEPVPLLSHNQQDMVVGALGSRDLDVNFNVEAKLQREQVLAALRRLDIGAMSMDDFQDMLFSIGVVLPEALAVDIRRAVASGRMDVKKYVKQLDASIFKSSAIEQHRTQQEIAMLRERFHKAVIRQGLDALLDLSQIFRDFDSDRDGALTFSEFRAGCDALALNAEINDNDLRLLFHSFDKNGDGVLQSDEFIESVRGPLSSTRALWVRSAFKKINRHGEDRVLIDIVANNFRPEGHPYVENGAKTTREVASEFVRWFTNVPDFDGTVKYPRFEKYFANISPHINSDEDFIAMIKRCWALSDNAPAPPLLKLRHKAGLPEQMDTPMAIQSHGDCITWNQEFSSLEAQAQEIEEKKGKKKIVEVLERNAQSDVINWKNHFSKSSTSENAIIDEFREMGINKISTNNQKNSSSKSLLSWCTQDKAVKNQKRVEEAPPLTVFNAPYQDEHLPAGVPRRDTSNSFGKIKTPDSSSLQSYKLNVPFGVDPIPQTMTPTSTPQPKSLANVLRDKNNSQSLRDFVK